MTKLFAYISIGYRATFKSDLKHMSNKPTRIDDSWYVIAR